MDTGTEKDLVGELPDARQRAYVLFVLTLVYTLAFVDRQIINILAEPIKQELQLADWQMGALAGFAFALLYTSLALPIARYSERASRPAIIAAALLVWSGFTTLSGLAQTFVQLLLARIGVGVGEAGCVAPAHSLITDITPRDKRASALAIFSAGIPLGSLVGMAVGGGVAHAYGWRAAFFLVGAPGVLLSALVVLTLGDPRKLAVAKLSTTSASGTLWATFARLRRLRSFVWMTAGAATVSFISFGHQTFYASFFLRMHGAELDRLAAYFGLQGRLGIVGISLGLILGIAGALGTVVGGRLADRLGAAGAGGYLTVPLWAMLGSLPLMALVFTLPSAGLALAVLAMPMFLKAMWYGPVFASVQSLVEPGARATAIALFLFVVNIVGIGLGPLCIGLLSDAFASQFGPAEGLRMAMITFSLQLAIPAACFAMARRTLTQEAVS